MEASQVQHPVEEAKADPTNPFEEFGPEIERPVRGLIHLGSLKDEFEFCGHHFVIRTLTAAEDIAAGQAVEPFRGNIKEPEAFAAAQVGLSLVSIDGDDSFCPQAGPDLEAYAKARLRYVTSNWYPPTIEFLFSKFTQLNGKMILAIEAIQNLSSRSLTTSTPLSDSSIRLEPSFEQTDSEFPNLTDSN